MKNSPSYYVALFVFITLTLASLAFSVLLTYLAFGPAHWWQRWETSQHWLYAVSMLICLTNVGGFTYFIWEKTKRDVLRMFGLGLLLLALGSCSSMDMADTVECTDADKARWIVYNGAHLDLRRGQKVPVGINDAGQYYVATRKRDMVDVMTVWQD